MKALIVDDSAGMRAFLRMALKGAGIEVMEAKNGLEGLNALRAGPLPDIAMLDWNMPEMDGYELLTAIRSDHSFDGVPIVMITTETEAMQIQKALQMGANEYIMKPFTKESVIEKLQVLGISQGC
jgi:two-component system chemotaxis response regulator CheY